MVKLLISLLILIYSLSACSFLSTGKRPNTKIGNQTLSHYEDIDNSIKTQQKSLYLGQKKIGPNVKVSVNSPEVLEKEVTISPQEIEHLEKTQKKLNKFTSCSKQKGVLSNGSKKEYFNFVLKIKDTKYTKKYYIYYTSIERKTFQRWLKRSELYLPYILKIFRKYNIPDDLAFLPFGESGFNPRAYSRAGAAGIWQFMPATARKYGLTVNWWIDERLDPFRSTIAAAKYLSDLYKIFGDWYLALAAYNAGEGKISKALKRTKKDNFFHIAKRGYLRQETRMYVPKFMAILKILRNLEKLGFEPLEVNDQKLPARIFVREGTDLYTFAKKLGVSWKKFRKWNPHFRRYVTPPSVVSIIYVPRSLEAKAKDLIKTKAIRPFGGLYRYKIKKGDSWWRISRRFGVPIKILKRINRTNKNLLRPGRSILIPKSKQFYLAFKKTKRNHKYLSKQRSWENKRKNYEVQPGDTLWDIARRFNVPLNTILIVNRLHKKSIIKPGMKLYIPRTDYKSLKKAQRALKQILYQVKKGDNLWGIAKRFGVTTNQLLTWNNLKKNSKIYPGDKIKIFIEIVEN